MSFVKFIQVGIKTKVWYDAEEENYVIFARELKIRVVGKTLKKAKIQFKETIIDILKK